MYSIFVCALLGFEGVGMVNKTRISNALLLTGVTALVCFAALELLQLQPDPLLPAFSAFFIGCTAVIDRLRVRQLK